MKTQNIRTSWDIDSWLYLEFSSWREKQREQMVKSLVKRYKSVKLVPKAVLEHERQIYEEARRIENMLGV